MASPDTEIRRELRKKLGDISAQSLSNRVRAIKDKVPAPANHALYVLAFVNGVQLDKHLDGETLAAAADWLERYQNATNSEAGSSQSSSAGASRAKKQVAPRKIIVQVSGTQFKDIPQFMLGHARAAEQVAEQAYPVAFLFENALRDLIQRVLHDAYGAPWWGHVPSGVKDKAQRYQDNEKKEKWHTPRGSDPIQYIDLSDLGQIIVNKALWPHFEPLFPRKAWVTSLIHDVNVSRRIIAHMNVLPADEVKSLQASFRKLAKQLRANEALIP